MFATHLPHVRMNEKAGGRTIGYVPMVYEKAPVQPMHWEYHVLAINTQDMALPDTVQLNELGQQGWILAGMLDERIGGQGMFVYYYFTRPQMV